MTAFRIAACIVLLSCTTQQKAEVTDKAFDDTQRRHELFEATLRALDGHPDYVDEFFNQALKHKTMDSFLVSTSRGLSDHAFARRVGEQLVAHPQGLRSILIETLEAARGKATAQQAIVEAVDQEAEITAAILVDHPPQLADVMKTLVKQLKAHPDTAGTLKDLFKSLI